jgi:putative transcriptional regulator
MSNQDQHYLTGKLLLAMPSIGDARFDHAVIYICAHDENGAMGLAINQSAPDLDFTKVLSELGVMSDIKIPPEALSAMVMNGGPVEQGRGFLLHSAEFKKEDTIKIDEAFGVTGTIEALKDLASGKGPDQFLFILGYAGWTAGQLEDELKQNSWLVCDPTQEIVFDLSMSDKWSAAMSTLGFDPSMLSVQAGSA